MPNQTLDGEAVVGCASLAPSVHNTQPWSLTAADNRIVVRQDSSKQLRWADPDGRLMLISCGAAIEFARLAIRGLDRSCHVQIDLVGADLTAELVAGDREPATLAEQQLIDAMARRYTDRGPYADRPIPLAVLDDASLLMGRYGVTIKPIFDREQRTAIIYDLHDAEAAENEDGRYRAELNAWVGADRDDDGVPLSAIPQWPQDRVSDVPLRDFTGAALPPDPAQEPPATVERDPIVVLVTRGDSAQDWVATGRAIALLTLRAAVAGISSQPLAPAVDFPAARRRLGKELGLIGTPQFILRLGYGEGRPSTPRRVNSQNRGTVRSEPTR